MTFKFAKIFSSGTEFEIFKANYCENGCIFHRQRKNDGFAEFTDNGGCPIEDRVESTRFDSVAFPNVLLQVWDGNKCVKWHHCPFFHTEDQERKQ